MSKRYTKEFIDKCYIEYSEGVSISKIASEHNVDRHSLSKALKRHFPDLVVSRRNYNKITGTPLNSKFFSVIDSEEKAYWLGFLYADGYLKKDKPVIELSLKSSDKEHLLKFLNSIESDSKIYDRSIKLNKKQYPSSRVCLYNRELHSNLESLGCMNNKSKILRYPTFLNKDMERHFIRGFFDGDGSITLESNSLDRVSRVRIFSGSEVFIKELSARLNRYLDIDINYVWDRTCFALVYGRKEEKIKVLDYMYKECNIYLDRKYTMYKNYACRFRS